MPPALPLVPTIQRLAASDCLAHATGVLERQLAVAVDTTHVAWDPMRLRHVLEQRMTVLQPLVDLEVILDAAGDVLGFIDHAAPAPSIGEEMPDADLTAALLATGVTGAPFVVRARRREPDGTLAVVLTTAAGKTMLARLDTGRGAVVSLEPQEPGAS